MALTADPQGTLPITLVAVSRRTGISRMTLRKYRLDTEVRYAAEGVAPNELRSRARGGTAVPTYLVDRDLPGITRAQLAAAHRAATETARRFTAAGKPVRYLGNLFLTQEARCLCLFEAVDAECVRSLNDVDVAQIPFTSVTEALELSPPTLELTLESMQ